MRAGVSVCLLCLTAVLAFVAMFEPNAKTAERVRELTEPDFGPVRDGKDRVMVYGLCARCFALPDRMARVERVLLAQGPER